MVEKELSRLYARLALQFNSVLGTLVLKNMDVVSYMMNFFKCWKRVS